MAGYSGTPLAKKLGIVEGKTVAMLGPVPEDVRALGGARPGGEVDVLLAFVTEERELRDSLTGWSERIDVDGAIWVCWPKKAARKVMPSDITEGTLREVCLPMGLVDVKVCAIDDVWSGLKIVWRKELRAGRRATSRGSVTSGP